MPERPRDYHHFSRILHWAVAGLIVVQFVLARLAEQAEHADLSLRELALLANHKSVGITILVLVVVRLAWRVKKPVPALPTGMPRWQTVASHISHWSLYGLLLAMPVTGWLMSSASAYSVSWFNLFVLPDFVGPDPELKEVFEEIHETMAKVLFALALLHIAAAVKHAIVDKDGVLSRMVSGISLALFAAIIATGVIILGSAGKAQPGNESAANGSPTASGPESTPLKAAGEGASNLPLWDINYEKSTIRFIGDQAGAEFEGEWKGWQAEIRFSEDQLQHSAFDVTVDTREVSTGDADRDSTLADADWFDSENHPYAYYRAGNFSTKQGGYVARGQLIIKGLTSPVALDFTVQENGNQRILESSGEPRLLIGQALLDRLALGVGTGEWEDTTWVGQEVTVKVRVEATVNP